MGALRKSSILLLPAIVTANGSLSQAVTDELERFNVGGAGKPRGESADQRSIPSPGGDGI